MTRRVRNEKYLSIDMLPPKDLEWYLVTNKQNKQKVEYQTRQTSPSALF